MKAAIYARFSSDLQRDRSIDDQVALCRDHAAKSGYEITRVYSDRAMSGASILGRDGLLTMMEDARASSFDVVVVEALDRLSRDQEDLAGIYKRLSFAGIEIRAVHDGLADQVQVGIRGLVGALYLQDLSHKVRRGMAGVTRDGRHAGGRAYGYRPVAGKAGELEIVPHEAEIVRRIFGEFIAGKSLRSVAAGLNADRVPPPRGSYWSDSAMQGNKKRGHGILINRIYAGTIVWNRVRMVKDPETGKRVSRVNPESEWQRVDAPQYAIVDKATFDRAQTILADRSQGERAAFTKRSHILSGLLKCHNCGASLVVKDRSNGRVRLQCSASRQGACSNTRGMYQDVVTKTVLSGLRAALKDKAAIAVFLSDYNNERRRLAFDMTRQRDVARNRLISVDAEINRLADLLIKGVIDESVGAEKMASLRSEKRLATESVAAAGDPASVIRLHPAAVDDYLKRVDNLENELAGHAERSSALREMIESLVVTPTDKQHVHVQVNGDLAAFTDHSAPAARLQPLGFRMVAEARYREIPQIRIPYSFTADSLVA